MKQLPQKIEIVERVPMSFEQQDLYDELRSDFVRDVAAAEKDGCDPSKTSSMMMQLRKAANHHLLHRRVYDRTKLRHMSQLMITVNMSIIFLFNLKLSFRRTITRAAC